MLKFNLIRMKCIKGRSFVAIMIIVAVSSLLLRFGIEQVIKINVIQNESVAQATLKLISTALENYAKDNRAAYPLSLSLLARSSPAYLDQDYISKSPIRGYEYSCSRLEPSGYACSAAPIRCDFSGKAVYTITTGGSLVSEECSKKE
jgi:competence protein ComGC